MELFAREVMPFVRGQETGVRGQEVAVGNS
jgi:hypothetical protein